MSADGRDVVVRFPPAAQRGIAGVESDRLAVLACGGVLATVCLRVLPRPTDALAAAAVALVAVVLASWTIHGLRPVLWLEVVGRHLFARSAGRCRSIAVGRDGSVVASPAGAVLGVRVEAAPSARGPVGCVLDLRTGLASVVVAVTAEPMSLLSDGERAGAWARWAALLNAAASGGALERLCWIERTVPPVAMSIGALRAPGAEIHLENSPLAAPTGIGHRHETVLVASTRTEMARQGEVAELLERRATEAGLHVEGTLSRAGLRRYLRQSLSGRAFVSDADPAEEPWALEEHWAAVRIGPIWHASFWIAQWPSAATRADFALPLLADTGLWRSVAVVMAPVPAARAARSAERRRTVTEADVALRRRHGFGVSARAERAREADERRAREVAFGHGAFRFSGFVTVHARTPDELEQGCERLDQLAALSAVSVVRLYGSQREGLALTLPTGRGL